METKRTVHSVAFAASARLLRAIRCAVFAAATVACSTTTFDSTWKAPGAEPLSFRGKKVVALVLTRRASVRYPAEDALAAELTAKGAIGIPAYTLIPGDVLQDQARTKAWLEKANVAGVVAMTVVGKEKRITSTPGSYSYSAAPPYTGFWGSGWGGVYEPGYVYVDTIVVVDTVVYSFQQDRLVWAAQSETINPSKVQPFVKELVTEVTSELKKEGLIG